METWFLILGFASVAVFQALIGVALMRDRARKDTSATALKLDELDADIASISHRLTKAQKNFASDKSIEARQESKSLRDEALDRLHNPKLSESVSARPSVVLPTRVN